MNRFHYFIAMPENRPVACWTYKGKYHGRYLDDGEYDLYSFKKEELKKIKKTPRTVIRIVKFLVYDYRQRH